MNFALWIVLLIPFIIGWVFAAINNGWRAPDLWVLSSIALYFILTSMN